MLITGILPGDCGLWVMSLGTEEILGHIVAVDSFNEVYVVPLQDTLKDMKEKLRVASVALLTARNLPGTAQNMPPERLPEFVAYKLPPNKHSGHASTQSSSRNSSESSAPLPNTPVIPRGEASSESEDPPK